MPYSFSFSEECNKERSKLARMEEILQETKDNNSIEVSKLNSKLIKANEEHQSFREQSRSNLEQLQTILTERNAEINELRRNLDQAKSDSEFRVLQVTKLILFQQLISFLIVL